MARETKLIIILRVAAVIVILTITAIGIGYALHSLVSSDELLVVGQNGVTPSLEVKGSPGLNQSTSLCERIQIRGFPRSVKQMMSKYTHSLEIIVNASAAGNTSNIQVCFHRNSSLAVGMCPHYGWEEVIDGLWTATMSPFDRKLLDVRVASSSSNVTLQVSTLQVKDGIDEFVVLYSLPKIQPLGMILGFVALNTQLLLAPDDSIDISTSLFISWSIRILAAVLILQSSGDALLAGGAVVFLIVMSPILRKITALIFPQRVREFLVYLVLQVQKGLVYVAGPSVTSGARQIMFYRARRQA